MLGLHELWFKLVSIWLHVEHGKTYWLLTLLYRKDFMGDCDKAASEAILDFFYEQGGNFIDTSNNYQFEESEAIIGDWMKKRGNRHEMSMSRQRPSYSSSNINSLIILSSHCNKVHYLLQIGTRPSSYRGQLHRKRNKES